MHKLGGRSGRRIVSGAMVVGTWFLWACSTAGCGGGTIGAEGSDSSDPPALPGSGNGPTGPSGSPTGHGGVEHGSSPSEVPLPVDGGETRDGGSMDGGTPDGGRSSGDVGDGGGDSSSPPGDGAAPDSSSSGTPPTPEPPMASDGGAGPDTARDGGSEADAGASPGTPVDAGGPDPVDVDGGGGGGSTPEDGGSGVDGGGGSTQGGPCSELSACCASLPGPLQGQCNNLASSQDSKSCSGYLGQAQSMGLCMSSPAVDAGASNSCDELQACCGTFPPTYQGQCGFAASSKNTSLCSAVLSQARQQNLCLASTGVDGGGSSPADAGGVSPGGDAGSAVPTDAGGPSSTDGGTAAACAELQSCCATLPAAVRPTCNQITSSNNGGTCTRLLTQMKSAGICGGTSVDGGTTSGASCSQLSTCCSGLSNSVLRNACSLTASRGNELQCSTTFQALEAAGQCRASSSPDAGALNPACSSLQSCCGTLSASSPYLPGCTSTVATNNGDACALILSSYQSAQVCSGGPGTP